MKAPKNEQEARQLVQEYLARLDRDGVAWPPSHPVIAALRLLVERQPEGEAP